MVAALNAFTFSFFLFCLVPLVGCLLMVFPALQTMLHGRAADAPASTGSQGTVESRVNVLYKELAFRGGGGAISENVLAFRFGVKADFINKESTFFWMVFT